MSGSKIVKRGYVLVYRANGTPKVTAVLRSRAEAEGLQRKVGGVIVPADGYAYRMAQKTLRVIVNPEAVIRRAGF